MTPDPRPPPNNHASSISWLFLQKWRKKWRGVNTTPTQVGSELLTIGGTKVQGLDGRKVLGLLRSSPRPVQMTFR